LTGDERYRGDAAENHQQEKGGDGGGLHDALAQHIRVRSRSRKAMWRWYVVGNRVVFGAIQVARVLRREARLEASSFESGSRRRSCVYPPPMTDWRTLTLCVLGMTACSAHTLESAAVAPDAIAPSAATDASTPSVTPLFQQESRISPRKERMGLRRIAWRFSAFRALFPSDPTGCPIALSPWRAPSTTSRPLLAGDAAILGSNRSPRPYHSTESVKASRCSPACARSAR
jgi:hypothetical protein